MNKNLKDDSREKFIRLDGKEKKLQCYNRLLSIISKDEKGCYSYSERVLPLDDLKGLYNEYTPGEDAISVEIGRDTNGEREFRFYCAEGLMEAMDDTDMIFMLESDDYDKYLSDTYDHYEYPYSRPDHSQDSVELGFER